MPHGFGNKHIQFILIPLQLTIMARTHTPHKYVTTKSDHKRPPPTIPILCGVCLVFCLLGEFFSLQWWLCSWDVHLTIDLWDPPLGTCDENNCMTILRVLEKVLRFITVSSYYKVDMQGFQCDLENTSEMDHSLDWCDVVFYVWFFSSVTCGRFLPVLWILWIS